MSAVLLPLDSLAPLPDGISLPVRWIGPVAVAAVDAPTAIAVLTDRLDGMNFTRIAFANAHCVNVAADDPNYRARLAEFTVFADGIGVDLASKMLHGTPFPDNLNGTDFVPRFLGALPGRRSVALVGAAPGVAELAAENLRRVFPQHDFQAISDGFFKDGLETEIVLARLRRFSPDITLVALGVPRQELFIARHLTIHETTLAIGVGALLDFMSGRVVRAPLVWRTLRLEWLFRLMLEPARLWGRYVVGNPRFLLRIFVQARRQRRPAAG